MEKYLTRLLEMNHRVIVPDLGAFILRQQDPRELVFNDLLAFDDGMLTERLMQEENLPKSEAQNRIRQFVDRLKSALQKGETYPLENLGSLNMDASGRIGLQAASEAEKDLKPDGGEAAPEGRAPVPGEGESRPETESGTGETDEPEPTPAKETPKKARTKAARK